MQIPVQVRTGTFDIPIATSSARTVQTVQVLHSKFETVIPLRYIRVLYELLTATDNEPVEVETVPVQVHAMYVLYPVSLISLQKHRFIMYLYFTGTGTVLVTYAVHICVLVLERIRSQSGLVTCDIQSRVEYYRDVLVVDSRARYLYNAQLNK